MREKREFTKITYKCRRCDGWVSIIYIDHTTGKAYCEKCNLLLEKEEHERTA